MARNSKDKTIPMISNTSATVVANNSEARPTPLARVVCRERDVEDMSVNHTISLVWTVAA